MKWKEVCVPLGLDYPYMVPKKEIAPLVLGGIIAGGSALLGGIANWISSNSANETNRDIAADTNATNMQINQDQLEWQYQQWLREAAENDRLVRQQHDWNLEQREYDSSQNQARRLLAAGINPALAMGSGAIGHSQALGSSVGSVPHANAPGSIPAQTGEPVRPIDFGSGISQAAQTYLSALEVSNKQKATDFDISARMNEMEMDYLKYLDQHADSVYGRKLIDRKIREMDDNFTFQKDQFEKAVEWQNFQKYVQDYQLQQKDTELLINQRLASSRISVDRATISELAQNVNESKQRVFEMAQNGASQREIDGFISRQQRANAEILERKSAREGRQNSTEIRQEVGDFVDWLFTPIKGIVNVGIK